MRKRLASLFYAMARRLDPSQEMGVQERLLANQQELLRLAKQGPDIVAAVTAAVNGGLGGRVGLGFQPPNYPGSDARY